MTDIVASPGGRKKPYFKKLFKDILRDRWLYLLMIPGIAYFILFRYAPMYGLRIAFQDYNPFNPKASPWVGLDQFNKLFLTFSFPLVLRNTLTISISKLVVGFPIPIILALLINEFRSVTYKRVVQTVLYLPHFISWVIMAGVIMSFLNPSTGFINEIIALFGGTKIDFLTSRKLFVPTLVVSDIYKSMGWGTIIYFASISAVDEEQYEAAIIDGANRFKQVIYITLPAIRPTIVVVFILNLGNILNAGFDQVFMLYNPLVYEVGDIIDTFVYRKGIVETNYSFSAAAGMFKSLVALILIAGSNTLVKALGERGIW
ncbi:MAG: ABC transporter permease subunit [Oscillospiraceae bacterium]|nr:ABC transporter permease subunit [Oscillospiraceae bacterium]